MTLNTTNSSVQTAGNGVTQAFPYAFKVPPGSVIQVYLVDSVTQASVLQTLSQYTLVQNPNLVGGSVNFFTAPPATQIVSIIRVTDQKQSTDITNQGAFFPEIHEGVWDNLVAMIQGVSRVSSLNLSKPFAGGSNYDAQGSKITGIGTATNQTDATNLLQVQSMIVGGAAPILIGPNGTSLVGTVSNGTGAVTRTQKSKNDEVLSVMDFGATGLGVADDTVAVVAADLAASVLGKTLYFPAGTYLVTQLTQRSSWRGEGMDISVVRRRSTTATGTFIAAGGSRIAIADMTLDGNKANNANGCNVLYAPVTVSSISMSRVRVTGAKVNAGWGSGMVVDRVLQTGASSIVNCVFDSNEVSGCAVSNATNLTIEGCAFFGNGTDGCNVNNYDQTFTQKIYQCRIVNNYFNGNGNSGLVVGNYVSNNSQSSPAYGTANPEALYCIIQGNTASANGYYGIAAGGFNILVKGNTCVGNAVAAVTTANILFTAQLSLLEGNVCEGALGCGIDAGGAQSSNIINNVVHGNGTVGINLEGNFNVKCSGNQLGQNGPSALGVQITVDRYGGASATQGFVQQGTNIVIDGNYIDIDGTRKGIEVVNGPSNVTIEGNKFSCVTPATDMFRFILAYGNQLRVNRNIMLATGATALTPTGGGVLIVPDYMEFAALNSAIAIGALFTSSAAAVNTGVAFCTITTGGTGYTSLPTIGFTGGGGSGAAATAIISAAGVLTGIRMTSFGTGYTSAPAVTITGGAGSGAVAVAVWKQGIPEGRELTLFCQQAETITRAGSITVENATATDTAVPVRGILTLKGLFSQWYVMSKNF